MMLSEKDREMFEKATARYYKQLWQFRWSQIGMLGTMVMVLGGIYFSQVAFAYFLGNNDILVIAFSYGVATVISAVEVAGVEIIGNKKRMLSIKVENKIEHDVMYYITYSLFAFDIFSNGSGLYLTILKARGEVANEAWFIIIGLSVLLGISEMLVGWMMRIMGTCKVNYLDAMSVYNKFQAMVDAE